MAQTRRLLPYYIRHPVEAVGAFILYWFFRLLPLGAAAGLGGFLGRAIGPRLKVSSRAVRNLAAAFPDKDAGEIAVIVRDMWDNLGRVAGEYPHLDRFDLYTDGGRVQVEGAEIIDQLRTDGKPGIFFSGHLANWELSSLAITQRGLPLDQVYRAANNPYLEWVYRRRQDAVGGALIPKGAKGAKELLQAMKDGRHVGMLVDQKMNDGIPVPFFGRDAMTAPALAQMALRYDCPVVPVRIERTQGSRFRVTISTPLTPEQTGDRHRDISAFMERINGLLEDWIRERPGQWLWVHRRWPD